MKLDWKAHWYRAVFAGILLAPALASQTVVPIVPYKIWEDWSESVYRTLLRFQAPDHPEASRVVVIEVDQKTIDTYGWPIDRSYYISLLAKLKQSGHPWIQSFLQFQSLDKAAAASPEERQTRAEKDAGLASAIKDYDRYVGSGLDIEAGAELTADQEETLLPRVLLAKGGKVPESIPYLPLNMGEDDRFVEAQRAFGFGTRFGTEAVINCMQFYITDANHTGLFVIPSSLVWTAALATDARFTTKSGASWPREGERVSFSPQRSMQVAFQQCLTSPSVLTKDFLETRRIQRHSLADVLQGESFDFAGKVIILASDKARRYRGPGIEREPEDAIVPDHVLAARFLDGLLTGQIIQREDLSRTLVTKWLPLVAAGFLSLASLFLSTVGVTFLALGIIGAILAYSFSMLLDGVFLIPMQVLGSVGLTAAGMIGLYAYLRYYGIRRQIRFAGQLREALSTCNTLAEVERFSRECAKREFDTASIEFGDFDRDLYEASSDAKAAITLLDKRSRESAALEVVAAGAFAERLATVLTRVTNPRGITRMPFRARGMDVTLAIESTKLGRLGVIKLGVGYLPHEEHFIGDLIDVIRVEVTQHWHRIKLLVDQKLLDYQFLMERTRGDIMERFLTHVLVSKFEDGLTMEQNLKAVLTPRKTFAALFQADIRGYSRVSAKMEPLAMVKLLQGYFSNVVDAAQMVAQVKLIGDCIFFFIEEQAAKPGTSPVDLALELASVLVSETMIQNQKRKDDIGEMLNFGIAIHYGEVVVGNLSSDSCIDYTVIGPNVNLVARLEELTKNQRIAEAIGANGTILSDEAFAALKKHRDTTFVNLVLEDLQVAVRSFPHIMAVKGLPASHALTVSPDTVLGNVGLRRAG